MIIQPIINVIALSILVLTVFSAGIVIAIKSRQISKKTMWSWLRRSLVILLVGASLFRPGIPQQQNIDVYSNQYDVYFVVDTTASMVAEDWTADGDTRLNGVKSDIGRIVDKYSGARYSLMTFDASPIIRAPLTKDTSAVMSAVNIMEPEITVYSKGSSISAANKLLASTLKKASEATPDRARIVFYFGDGEQTVSQDPQSFSSSAEYITNGAVYGYGTEQGGKMKQQNGYIITSNQDEYIMDTTQTPPIEALSKINVPNLESIAQQLNVDYVQRSSNEPPKLPEIDSSDITLSGTSQIDATYELTWLLALMAYTLLVIEAGITIRLIRKVSKEGRS